MVTVAQSKESKNIWLANNGKVDASTKIDMPTQVLCAHLPFIFQKDAQDVMVIGLASGITAGSITLHTAPKRIDVIELEPAIVFTDSPPSPLPPVAPDSPFAPALANRFGVRRTRR